MKSLSKLIMLVSQSRLWKIDISLIIIFIFLSIIGNPKVIVSSQTLNSETPNKFKRMAFPVIPLPIEKDSIIIQKLDTLNINIDKVPKGTEASEKVIGVSLRNKKLLTEQNIVLKQTLNKLRYDSLVIAQSREIKEISKSDSIKLESGLPLPEVKIDSCNHKKGLFKRLFGF